MFTRKNKNGWIFYFFSRRTYSAYVITYNETSIKSFNIISRSELVDFGLNDLDGYYDYTCIILICVYHAVLFVLRYNCAVNAILMNVE